MIMVNSKIETIQNYFKTRPVLKAYLFGSYVRGEADDKSDIQMKIDLEKLLNSKVDLVSSGGLSKYIKPIVDGEKQLIYAR
jgi:predicted nucleotidyltransferase